MHKSKKLFSMLLALIMAVTGVISTMPFTLQTFAAAVKSDDNLIMNFDFGYGEGTGENYSCKDYFSNAYMKAVNYSNADLPTTAYTSDGEKCVFVNNGYVYSDVSGSQLYGNTSWSLDFKIMQDYEGTSSETALIALGSAKGANGISDANTADILRIHQNGRIFIHNTEINDSAANGILALSLSEKASYSIIFNENTQYLTITKNGQTAFKMHLNSEQIKSFEQIGFISLGSYNSSNSQNDVGKNSVTLRGFYYYLKAYTIAQLPETAGRIKTDPVIYTHGNKDDSDDYDYMMYGTRIADGTVDGEQKTKFTLPYGAVLEDIICADSDNLDCGRDSDGSYFLKGEFSSDTYQAKDGAEVYADIGFQYSLNGKSYIEYHRFCVKTNPVPTHGMIYGQAYKNTLGYVSNKSAVAFQNVAVGSVGSLNQSMAEASMWTGDKPHTYRANSWNIFAPYDSSHAANDSNNGNLSNTLVDKSDNSTVDKTAGYGVTGSKSGGSADIGATTEPAQYYVDKSADSILGAKHNAGESTYSIDMFTENIYQSFNTSNGTVHITQHEFNASQGSLELQTNSNWSWDEDNDKAWKWYNAWDNNQRNSETVTLQGSTDNGNVRGSYWVAAQNYDGNGVKATVITNIIVNVFDKTAPRNTFNNDTLASLDSSYYDAAAWEEYRDARLAVEGYLNNYERSSVDDSVVQTLITKYDNLGTAADYSALIAAIEQAQDILSKSDIYTNTADLTSAVNETLNKAFSNAALDGDHKLKDQQVVDQTTRDLQFVYTETVLNKTNIKITFNVYLDNVLQGTVEKQGIYKQDMTLDAAEILSDAENYQVVKWTLGGITVANEGASYTFSPKTKGVYDCYLISTPNESDALCKVELLDIAGRKEMDFYVSRNQTYADVISIAQSYTDEVLYYAISGWEIDGMTDYNITDSLNGQETITIQPVYTPTVQDYKLKVSGGSLDSENGYVFDARACIAFDDTSNAGEFLCWAVKFDSDDSYRVVSYNQIYDFYISGNMEFVAITDTNFNSYKDKLQANTTELDKTPARPTIDELRSKKAIPSLRGPVEDATSIAGTYYDTAQRKLYIVAQVADGADYDSCGVVSMMGGRTIVSPSTSQTKSGQYIISYNFTPSYADRTLTVLAYSKSGTNGDDIIYSPSIDVTIPGDETVVTIGNDKTNAVTYDMFTGRYNVIQNNQNVLTDVTAEFKTSGDTKYDVSNYTSHTYKTEAITDGAGNGTKLTVISTKEGYPTAEQTFRVYDNQDYVLTDVKIYNPNGGEIATNYIAPVKVSGHNSFKDGNTPWSTFLYTPFDNDSWSRFKNFSLTASGGEDSMSHEVTALYDAANKNGLIIGSVTHDTWKTGIEYTGASEGVTGLAAYGGAKTIEISGDNPYRGETEHGTVKGTAVTSPTIFIGDYSDWQYGMMQFAAANTAIVPARTEGDLGGVPFGWNSWGSIASELTYENAVENINYIKNNFQSSWETDKNGSSDGTPVVMNLDSWWNEIKIDNGDDDPWNDNEPALRAFVAQCEANGQIPGIYHTPFVTWCSQDQLNDPDEAWWTHPERVLRKSDGSMYDSIDGGFPLDPTNPDVIQENINRINYFKSLGFKYVKLDFLTHGTLEGQFYNKDITTGIQAFNYGMQTIVDACNEGDDNMFINYSIAPLFPYQYANGRRMGCDTWYSTDNAQYALNQLTYGFWEEGIYNYPDPDHAVIYGRDGKATEAQAKNIMTLNAAVAGNMLLGDSFVDYSYADPIKIGDWVIDADRRTTYKAEGCINRANKVLWNKDIIEIAKKGKTFKSVIDSTPEYANVYRMEDNGDIYYAVFNFSGKKTYRLEIPQNYYYSCQELWSGDYLKDGDSLDRWLYVDVTLNGEDSKIYKFSPTRPF